MSFNKALKDKKISLQAKGLLAYGLSFGINVKQLVSDSKNGRDSVYAALNELMAAGYVTRVEQTNAAGRLEYSYTINIEVL